MGRGRAGLNLHQPLRTCKGVSPGHDREGRKQFVPAQPLGPFGHLGDGMELNGQCFSLFSVRILAAGIAIVHAPEGWFVVGGGRNGVEHSVALIAIFLAVAWAEWKGRDTCCGQMRVLDDPLAVPSNTKAPPRLTAISNPVQHLPGSCAS